MQTITINGREYRLAATAENIERAEHRGDFGILQPIVFGDVDRMRDMLSKLHVLRPLIYEMAVPVTGDKPTYEDWGKLPPLEFAEHIDAVLETVYVSGQTGPREPRADPQTAPDDA
jgi:hypothetical protein